MPVPPLSRCSLLLVEDDRMVRETIMLMLEDDYEISHAGSVASTLALMRAPELAPIDVMLLDCLLPDGNLADVLSEADQRSIPVVMISGDPSQAETIAPGRPFLSKPFSQATLLKILENARG
jgi:DNA-binding NtrC family response regulator